MRTEQAGTDGGTESRLTRRAHLVTLAAGGLAGRGGDDVGGGPVTEPTPRTLLISTEGV